MAFRNERQILDNIFYAARSSGELTKVQWERLRSTFGQRFDRAWKLVEERRIKQYIFEPSDRTFWIAVGRDREYQILPASGYCSCNDFYFRVVDGDAGLCYHLLGQRLAEALEEFEVVEEGDEFFEGLMEEWRRLSADQADE